MATKKKGSLTAMDGPMRAIIQAANEIKILREDIVALLPKGSTGEYTLVYYYYDE